MHSRLIVAQNIPTPAQTNLLVFKDYIPLLQTFVWPVFWLIVFLVFKKQITNLFDLVKQQIEKGGTVEVAGFKLVGKLVEKTSDLVASDLVDKVETFGNSDRFKLLFKAQARYEGSFFMKSTKAMKVPGGCVIQVTNERQNPDGSWSVAESLTFVPGEVTIKNERQNPDGSWSVVDFVPGEVTIKDNTKYGRFLDESDQVLESE